ncbi:hypothetical protein [Micromonospora maritima]|uniref:hypothetical protein n=1 Tax=Micromonospora maritima TaxID=986711 RepID=UPI00157D606C|nr:hypothetical protein [Micromonospora maritima]
MAVAARAKMEDEIMKADHYVERGQDEQFLIRSETGFAVFGIGEIARWIEASQYDDEERFDRVWHLPPGGEPVPCTLPCRRTHTSKDGAGFDDYAWHEVDAVPENTGEPVATGVYRTDLRS